MDELREEVQALRLSLHYRDSQLIEKLDTILEWQKNRPPLWHYWVGMVASVIVGLLGWIFPRSS
jgi:hypothetical protein